MWEVYDYIRSNKERVKRLASLWMKVFTSLNCALLRARALNMP